MTLVAWLVAWLVAKRGKLPLGRFPGWREFILASAYAIPGLMTAVIIMGGILSGFFTPTESSAIAVIYTCLLYTSDAADE